MKHAQKQGHKGQKGQQRSIGLSSITLTELPEQGQHFSYTKQTGELNSKLKDLIQDHPYAVSLNMSSVGNAFQVEGHIDCQMDLLCSRCAREMTFTVDLNFQELIVVTAERPRAGHSGHTGQEDGGIFCNYQTSYFFDIAEFIHEQIAASEPFAPLCSREDCEKHFTEAQAALNQQPQTASPFEVLKKLKNEQ